MKTQKFTNQQLNDLVEGKEVVTCDVVKEGEKLTGHPADGTPCIIIEDNKEMVTKVLFESGETVQATNEKGGDLSFFRFSISGQ